MIVRKFMITLLILSYLFIPALAGAAEAVPSQQIQQELKAYFDLRYRILSTLAYDRAIEKHLAPEILSSREALSEADVLETMTEYRKAQINDLRFSQYTYDLSYGKVQENKDMVSISVREHYMLYYNCAPTVKNEASIDHSILLKNYGGRWLIVKDDYADPEGIKKMLTTFFINEGLSLEEAKANILSQTDLQLEERIKKLDQIMKGTQAENATVFFIDKPIAYVSGYSGKIDDTTAIKPIEKNSTVYLPLRFVAEKKGVQIEWDKKSAISKLHTAAHTLEIRNKEKTLLVDGKKWTFDEPILSTDGRTLVPAAVIAHIFDETLHTYQNRLVILSGDAITEGNNQELIQKLEAYGSTLFTKADFPRIDGSTATYPLSMEIGKALLGLDETGVKGFITHQTTHEAYVNLISGEADIIFVTQPSPEELSLAAQKGIELDVVPLCKEGFVFLVNRDNPVKSLTSRQIQAIYQGKITNWKEIGGVDQPITPYQREANSGSQTIMENTVMKGLTMMAPPKELIVYGMGQLIDRVADYSNARNALGYSVYYYATQMYQNRDVKLLAVDNITPDPNSIKNGTYPFTVGYYAVLRKGEPETHSARRLLNWLLSSEGQEIVERAGLVSVR